MSFKEGVFERATNFLNHEGISFVNVATIGRKQDEKVEVIFPVIETLDLQVACIDPPDVRVWVYLGDDVVSLIEQM